MTGKQITLVIPLLRLILVSENKLWVQQTTDCCLFCFGFWFFLFYSVGKRCLRQVEIRPVLVDVRVGGLYLPVTEGDFSSLQVTALHCVPLLCFVSTHGKHCRVNGLIHKRPRNIWSPSPHERFHANNDRDQNMVK